MKNKEIEEILKYLKNKFYISGEFYTEEKIKVLSKKELDLLLSYIEQLEKIPNKVLDFIHKNSYKKGDGTIMYDVDIQELENIIKGDKND